MTPAQWKALQDSLNTPYGYAKLMVDGYVLTIQVERSSPKTIKYELVVYVNGLIQWRQGKDDCDERRRFWRKTVRRVHSPAAIAKILKGLGKREAARFSKSMGLDKTFDFYVPYFPTFASLKKQLIQNNQDIQVWNAPNPPMIDTDRRGIIEGVAP
jgi:hypothetical protein